MCLGDVGSAVAIVARAMPAAVMKSSDRIVRYGWKRCTVLGDSVALIVDEGHLLDHSCLVGAALRRD